MDGEVLTAPVLVTVLQFLALSAIATDRFQSTHWIASTQDAPLIAPNGYEVYELNPILAGKPEVLEQYMEAREAICLSLPRMLGPPLGVLALAVYTLDALSVVVRNNEHSAVYGYPQYYVLAYRWTW